MLLNFDDRVAVSQTWLHHFSAFGSEQIQDLCAKSYGRQR